MRKIVGMLILLSFLSGCAIAVRPIPPGLFTPIPLHIHIMRTRIDIMHTHIPIIIVGIGILVLIGINREYPLDDFTISTRPFVMFRRIYFLILKCYSIFERPDWEYLHESIRKEG